MPSPIPGSHLDKIHHEMTAPLARARTGIIQIAWLNILSACIDILMLLIPFLIFVPYLNALFLELLRLIPPFHLLHPSLSQILLFLGLNTLFTLTIASIKITAAIKLFRKSPYDRGFARAAALISFFQIWYHCLYLITLCLGLISLALLNHPAIRHYFHALNHETPLYKIKPPPNN